MLRSLFLMASIIQPAEEPQFKDEDAGTLFEAALEKFENEKYRDARRSFQKLLRRTADTNSRTIVRRYVADCSVGEELIKWRQKLESGHDVKDSYRVLRGAMKLLEEAEGSSLLPDVKAFIAGLEETLFYTIDDFEPGGKTDEAIADLQAERKRRLELGWGAWYDEYEVQKNVAYVKRGTGSLRWQSGGDAYHDYWYHGYLSPKLPPALKKYRYLKLWVYAPKPGYGLIRVHLMPRVDSSPYSSLYCKRNFNLSGKKGWVEVTFDLRRDFGNTQNVDLGEVRYVRIVNAHATSRTLYLDWLHLAP